MRAERELLPSRASELVCRSLCAAIITYTLFACLCWDLPGFRAPARRTSYKGGPEACMCYMTAFVVAWPSLSRTSALAMPNSAQQRAHCAS